MNLYEYIAVNNSLGANELLKNYGLKPSRSIDELVQRLKQIVRKYKKTALQDLTSIHPDKELLSMFNTSNISDNEFAYATGRTPIMGDGYDEDEKSSDDRPMDGREIVLEDMARIKAEILEDKLRRSKKELDSKIRKTQYGDSPVILLAIGFAVGYMIAKK